MHAEISQSSAANPFAAQMAPESLACRNARLRAHQPLVRSIATRLRSRLPANVELDDLIQVGMIGLNEAMSRFEDGRGATFNTYAARRIQGAMLDALRASDTLSRDRRAQLREVRAAVHRLEHRLGRTPRAKEVSNELGWTLDAFHDCMVDVGAGGAREGDEELENLADEGLSADGDTSVDEHADPLRCVQQHQRHAALNAAFDALEARERRVMEMIYDLELTLQEVGVELGVSASRVSQMHEQIVSKLRLRLRQW